jgi:hypothetical protein
VKKKKEGRELITINNEMFHKAWDDAQFQNKKKGKKYSIVGAPVLCSICPSK